MKTLATLCALAVLATSAALADGFQDTAGKHLDVMRGEKPIVRYMYGRDDSTDETRHETYKVYHHVMDPTGETTLTKGPGGEFTHHRGLFIGWNRLQHDGRAHDLWHMTDQATQAHREFLVQEADAEKSVIATRIDWLARGGEVVCVEETRTLTVWHNDPNAHVVIDFQSDLKAANGDINLLGDPEHAGMQYRASQDASVNKSATYIFHADGIDPTKDRDLPWVAMRYEMANGDVVVVQHMNHPDNPKDTLYSAYRDYGRFGAFFETPVADGETLTVKYRLRITKGEAPAVEALAAQYAAYAPAAEEKAE